MGFVDDFQALSQLIVGEGSKSQSETNIGQHKSCMRQSLRRRQYIDIAQRTASLKDVHGPCRV